MKKATFAFLFYIAVLAKALGQGSVNFLNDLNSLSSPPDRLIRLQCGNPPGQPAFGTNLQVQLYYGASGSAESSLIPLSAASARLRVSTSAAVGTWQGGGMRTFQTAGPGAQLFLQVRVWDINDGATYEAAASNPNNRGGLGESALFGYVVPQPTDPPAAFNMNNFVGFSFGPLTCPEPSVFALTWVGAAALLAVQKKTRTKV